MSYRIGVDIGGTFTDFCAFDEANGTVHTHKVLSTPDRPGAEVVEGLVALKERYGITPADVSYFTHGTTVGVNTVIQRKGVNLCLFTTKNFEDVLEVARLKMPDPYDLFSRRPVPLVTKEKVFQIGGRILADGSEDQAVDEDSVRSAIAGVATPDVVAALDARMAPAVAALSAFFGDDPRSTALLPRRLVTSALR